MAVMGLLGPGNRRAIGPFKSLHSVSYAGYSSEAFVILWPGTPHYLKYFLLFHNFKHLNCKFSRFIVPSQHLKPKVGTSYIIITTVQLIGFN